MPAFALPNVTIANPVGRPAQVFFSGGTPVYSGALETGHVIKPLPGTLLWLVAQSTLASAKFIQVFNLPFIPANGTVPLISVNIGATATVSIPLPTFGVPFNTGITVASSTTVGTLTIGLADCWFMAMYL